MQPRLAPPRSAPEDEAGGGPGDDAKDHPDVSGLGEAPPREGGRVGVVRQAQSRISRAMFAKRAKDFVKDLRAHATTTADKKAALRLLAARGKGAMAWVGCQGTEHWDRVDSDSYREMLARGLGSPDAETPMGADCHAGCVVPPTLTHALACTREGMQTHTHEAVLREFVVRTLRECHVPHEVESEAPFKQGTGAGQGMLRMDVVTPPEPSSPINGSTNPKV